VPDGQTGAVSAPADRQPSVPGDRVVLRPWTRDDADVVFAACQDPEIQRWTTVPSPYRHEDAVCYVTEISEAAWRDGGGVFAICVNGAPAGAIGAHGMRDGVAHVGYWMAADARGRGFASDALRTISRWLIGERGAARVELVAEPENTPSLRVAERAGFTREGVLRQRLVTHGRRADAVMFSLLPGELSGA
jgi:RimJ/RimL family protein N-acetyltransferase